jgi:hypothetical protein
MPFSIVAYLFIVYGFWLYCLVSILNASVFSISLISIIFGWKWWYDQRDKVIDEPGLKKFLFIPVFCSIAIFIIEFSLKSIILFINNIAYIQFQEALLNYRLLFATITSFTISFLLYSILKKCRWMLIDIVDWVMALPLFLIEYPIARLICNQKKEIDNE